MLISSEFCDDNREDTAHFRNFLGLSDLLISAFQKNMNHQQLDTYQNPVLEIKSEQNDTCREIL